MSRRAELTELAELFGSNLLYGRRSAGISQRALGDLVGMRRENLSELERGLRLPRLDTILKLAAGTNLSTCEVLAGMRWDPVPPSHFRIGIGLEDEEGHERADQGAPGRPPSARPAGRVAVPSRSFEPIPLLVSVGEVVKALRREKGLTQQGLAGRAGLHFTYISQIERGVASNPSWNVLGRLCQGLGVRRSELAKRVEDLEAR